MRYILIVLIALFSNQLRASHVMGGELTWTCQGGNYVFELVFYRDCNGAEVNTISETINVWNHPTITSIQALFISRVDISPLCTQVPGSPPQLTCGNGASGGNGIGAIEKVTYRSAPMALPGTPPAAGWIFTAQNFSRSNAITNLINPSNYGITIAAYMFPIPGATTGCVDSSPKFLQEPYLVTCAGTPYVYNMNAVDADLDSIAVSFGAPLNNFPAGSTFNPPTNPIEIPFETGFSANSPTPNNTFNAANVATAVNSSTGEITFTSQTTGNFVVKLIVKSYRQGVLIAQVEREVQLVVMNCLATNNPPVVTGPFPGGLFETTIFAGDLVNFNLNSTDVELLQNGTPQSNIMTASGLMFGTNFTSTTGCGIIPCATLNSTPAITGVQGVATNFNWQTDCDHLVNQYGIVAEEVPYHFVFRFQDNFCQVPKVTYATITIHVKNPGIIYPPAIDCIQTAANGDLTIRWTPVTDPNNSFISYKIRKVSSAAPLATINTINTNSFVVTGITAAEGFYIEVVSGCDGNTTLSSDTVKNIHLTLANPSDGTAVLSWNQPVTPINASLGAYYHILREYPAGVWTIIDSVAYGTQLYKDTIDICQAFLNYQIVLPTTTCDFTSNIEGDNFEDKITPDIPVIGSVSIDTLTGDVTITWDPNGQSDTYGYVIYMADPDGILFELDTVFGINNNSYTFSPNTANGPLSFSVAAFDSCFTISVPPTYQTSAKGELNKTIFAKFTYNICKQIATLQWTPYVGWADLSGYEIYGRLTGGAWTLFGTTTQTTFSTPVTGLQLYEFVIRGINDSGQQAFSNKISVSAIAPTEPSFHYTKVATVSNEYVKIKHYIELVGGISKLSLEKKNANGVFESIEIVDANATEIEFIDSDVATDRKTYTYRVRIIDSCGNEGAFANEVTTILLRVQSDDIGMVNYLSWSPYKGFNGSIIHYNVYRGFDGVYAWLPIATVPSHTLYYEDNLINEFNLSGKICYFVEAVESINIYSFSEISRSNEVCALFEPLIYIPNAFTPGGINPIFRPIVSLINPQSYRLSILDRWGQVIFESTDLSEGWDGKITLSDQMAPTGLYMYVLRVKDGAGEEITKRGSVSLLR